jgi:hypothetical protein
VNLALQTLLGSVCLVRGNHLDETEATRLLGVRVAHDVALLDLTILLEQTCDLILGQRRVNASDEEVGALVAALFRLTVARLRRRATAVTVVAAVGGGTAGARVVITTLTAR